MWLLAEIPAQPQFASVEKMMIKDPRILYSYVAQSRTGDISESGTRVNKPVCYNLQVQTYFISNMYF
jgi:hypothetical protein